MKHRLPPRITLASASPRRHELLTTLGIPFSVQIPAVDERVRLNETPRTCAERLAKLKADAIDASGALILAADTLVVHAQELLGKPHNAAHAQEMLSALSGSTHQVITGVCLRQQSRSTCFSVVTDVTFRALSSEEIVAYIATGDPMDKAGAYAIQGGAAHMVERINGSYTNVVGLPLCELYKQLIIFCT